jgi:Peptidase A4 family
MAMSDLYPGRKRPLIVSKVDIDALKKRFEGFPVPEGPFDFSADPERLADFGLPPKPDAAQTLRLKAWERGFGKPVALQPFKFDDELVERIEKTEYRLLHRQADEIRLVETRFESSSNWSGAYITANHNRRFLQIWGTWTIPGLLRLPPGPFQGPPGKTYVCSNWIGLDGQRRYLDSSLPQIGTQSTLQADGTTTAEAWVQWWARGGANDPPLLLPVGFVSPGDTVLCVLTALSPQTAIFVMVNLSATPWPTAMAVMGSAPLVTLPNGTTVEPTIAGATAEWIVERPRIWNSPDKYYFPDYGQSDFTGCLAVEANQVNIASLPAGRGQQLQGARCIQMFDVLPAPMRTAFISMPKKFDNSSTRVTYGGF